MRELDADDLVRMYRDADGYSEAMLSAMWEEPEPRRPLLTCARLERIAWWGVAICGGGALAWIGGRWAIAALLGG